MGRCLIRCLYLLQGDAPEGYFREWWLFISFSSLFYIHRKEIEPHEVPLARRPGRDLPLDSGVLAARGYAPVTGVALKFK